MCVSREKSPRSQVAKILLYRLHKGVLHGSVVLFSLKSLVCRVASYIVFLLLLFRRKTGVVAALRMLMGMALLLSWTLFGTLQTIRATFSLAYSFTGLLCFHSFIDAGQCTCTNDDEEYSE